jgi:hypothetical protein
MKLRPAKWGQSFSLRCGNPESHLTGSGHSQPGRANSRSSHVGYSLKAEAKSFVLGFIQNR